MNKESIETLLSQIGVISFIETNENSSWYIIPVDYWVMNHWGQWGISWELKDKEKEIKFLEIIDQFKITLSDITEYFNQIDSCQQIHFMPKVYADFVNRKFYTNFEEWILEDSILESWEGKRREIRDLCNSSFRYWENKTN